SAPARHCTNDEALPSCRGACKLKLPRTPGEEESRGGSALPAEEEAEQQRLKEAFQSLTERNRHLSTIAEKLGTTLRGEPGVPCQPERLPRLLEAKPGAACATRNTRPLLQHFMGGPFHRLLLADCKSTQTECL
uniref:Obesity factor n=1 Tax=Macrostomum lignano TaxID=282301 RepID=A0A1I8FED0_9PLAT